jgi:hypothetical protein
MDCFEVSSGVADRIRQWLEPKKPAQRPFALSSASVTQRLRARLGHPDDHQLSSHSLKKTALVRLAETGYSAEDLAFKAKHASTRLLKEYIGARLWAVVHKAHSMGQALGKILASS